MSNLKFVAGTVKRRGIAIAAAVAVAGGSLATANYAMAVEANEPTQQELEAEFLGTEAGNIAAETADEYNKALKSGASEDQLRQILENGLKSAAQVGDAGFSAEDLAVYDQNQLNNELQGIVDSTKQSQEKEIPAQPENPAAKWATPAPAGKYSPQRLEAEFGGTEEGKAAEETARIVADALRRGTPEAQVRELIKERLLAAGFSQDQIGKISDEQLNGVFELAKKKADQDVLNLNEERQEALVKLQELENLNPLQRSIFKKQIEGATSVQEVKTVSQAAEAENNNPVAPFAPAPGQETPSEAPDTDVEKALDYTKAEALEKLRGLTHLTEQQKAFYEKMVNDAEHIYEVEDAYEAGVAKNQVNEEAKKASGFLAKAIARTKHLALEKLDGFEHLTHEQKKEARNKIVAAKQVFEVEAAFHAAEKLNKAAK
ncbi:GA module-containing protein [Corynebacterium pseudodiphtheriticum]|uniref:GA module-containing protein n=1 Tax=Corynebacterium pseudodiphtheriticum TaxID=37637 RepID=UPI0020C09D06|nr:GA module-containing protein [Corynebacterium pseudodiphtheriticum]UQV57525.1 GA module-containing protein [Corynebacterium pseudodiphtheriticum]